MPRVHPAILAATVALVVAAGMALVHNAMWTSIEGKPAWLRAGIMLAFDASILGIVAAVWAAILRRDIARLNVGIEEAADAPGERAVRVAPWLQPLAESLTEIVRNSAGRNADLAARLREVEIRKKLSESELEHAGAILDSLRDAVIVTDAFNEICTANTRAGQLLGFDPQQALHQPVAEVINDEDLVQLIHSVSSAGVANKQRHVEREIEGPFGSGSFDITLAALPGTAEHDPSEAGESRSRSQAGGGVVVIIRDVTREKEISRMKSDFVSQASHELRTPLSSINAYVEMLLEGEVESDEARREFYEIIKTESDRVSRLVDNMLNISRIEAGIQKADHEEVDFVSICREVVDTLHPQTQLKDIKVSLKSGPLVYTAEADRDMMTQVVTNLLGNALKYTPEGGRVSVEVDNDDATRSVMVSVSDTGLGIPPEAVDKVFDKFYRIESYKRVAKGTGLGLNLVKHIVETVHKGAVGVESEVGMGSRFWFSIPYKSEALDAAA